MNAHRKIEFESLSWHSPAPGVRFKLHQDAGRQLRLLEFTTEFIEPDWCEKGHAGCVIEGELEIDFNGKIVRFKTGDALLIAAGEADKHKARAVSPVVKLFLVEDC